MRSLSPAIKAASAFAMGGAASAAAHLLLARYLTTQSFGEFSLVLAITTFSVALGPLSLDAVVLRHRPGLMSSLLRMSSFSGIIAGIVVATLASWLYSFDPGFLPFIAITTAARSVARVGASVYQSEQKYKWST